MSGVDAGMELCGCDPGFLCPGGPHLHPLGQLTDLDAYFQRRVDLDGDHWLWLGRANVAGYGVCNRGNAPRLAHRAVWEALGGRIGTDHLHHLCRVKLCLRPAHLARMKASPHKKLHASEITHCAYGHELTPENSYLRLDGDGRQCMKCNARRMRDRTRALPKSERRKLDLAKNERRRERKLRLIAEGVGRPVGGDTGEPWYVGLRSAHLDPRCPIIGQGLRAMPEAAAYGLGQLGAGRMEPDDPQVCGQCLRRLRS